VNIDIRIENLPPSAKLVFKILEKGGLLTQKDITRESYLPPRTVRYALDRLKKKDILEERFYFKDARQSLYGIKNFQDAKEGDLHV
jgi:DNA-binding MarR family transcriptional regulator